MSKRDFRSSQTRLARYPTFESFDRPCRDLLAGVALGAALFLGGCGDRTVAVTPDAEPADAGPDLMTTHPPGSAPYIPSRQDLRLPPDAGRDLRPSPDLPEIAGGPPLPPAPIDLGSEQD